MKRGPLLLSSQPRKSLKRREREAAFLMFARSPLSLQSLSGSRQTFWAFSGEAHSLFEGRAPGPNQILLKQAENDFFLADRPSWRIARAFQQCCQKTFGGRLERSEPALFLFLFHTFSSIFHLFVSLASLQKYVFETPDVAWSWKTIRSEEKNEKKAFVPCARPLSG